MSTVIASEARQSHLGDSVAHLGLPRFARNDGTTNNYLGFNSYPGLYR